MDKPDESQNYINAFHTCISKLKEHKSVAVGDKALMSALILHGVRAKEYHKQKLKITTDLQMSTNDILTDVCQHFIAYCTMNKIAGQSPGDNPG